MQLAAKTTNFKLVFWKDNLAYVVLMQSMDYGNEDLLDLTRATQQEKRLAAGARSLADRWERDVVYLNVLFNPVVKHQHRIRLLKSMELEVSTTTQSVLSGEIRPNYPVGKNSSQAAHRYFHL